jgi:hypothetical protein
MDYYHLCVECKWFRKPNMKIYAETEVKCAHPNNSEPDLVFGGTREWSPSWLRATDNKCGFVGNWWEQK